MPLVPMPGPAGPHTTTAPGAFTAPPPPRCLLPPACPHQAKSMAAPVEGLLEAMDFATAGQILSALVSVSASFEAPAKEEILQLVGTWKYASPSRRGDLGCRARPTPVFLSPGCPPCSREVFHRMVQQRIWGIRLLRTRWTACDGSGTNRVRNFVILVLNTGYRRPLPGGHETQATRHGSRQPQTSSSSVPIQCTTASRYCLPAWG